MSELCRLSAKHGSDKHLFGYTLIYDRLLRSKAEDKIKLLEIGVKNGNSMRLWEEYLPRAEVHGIDIKVPTRPTHVRYRTHYCDQSDREQLRRLVADIGSEFDIVIDDGSHQQPHIMISLEELLPHVSSGGIYIIEDVANRQISLEKGKLWGTREKDFSDSVIATFERLRDTRILTSPYLRCPSTLTGMISSFEIYYAQIPPLTKAGTSDLIIIHRR